jgi:hypothetical protein
MTGPVDPNSPEAQAAVAAQIAAQAGSIENASPDVPSGEELAAAGAAPTQVDVDKLLAELQTLAARVQEVAPAPEPEPADRAPKLAGDQPQWLHEAFSGLHERLAAVEDKLGI